MTDGLGRFRRAVRRVDRDRRLRPMRPYLEAAERAPNWTSALEREELALACRSRRGDAVIVEIGAFLGSSTVILAGSRQVARRGTVHSVDPFDGSGDAYSAPIYRDMIGAIGTTARARFEQSIGQAGVADRVTVHEGTAESVIGTWSSPIDLLFLDGDQSPAGARTAFDLWEPWLRVGGLVVLTNSAPRDFAEHHDGQFLVASELVVAPRFIDRRVIGHWTFARKAAARPSDS